MEGFYNTRYQSGSFSLINLGNGFHYLCSLSFLFSLRSRQQPLYISWAERKLKCCCSGKSWTPYGHIAASHKHTHTHTYTHTYTHTQTHTQFVSAGYHSRMVTKRHLLLTCAYDYCVQGVENVQHQACVSYFTSHIVQGTTV